MESLDLLRSIPMFGNLSEEDLRALAAAVVKREYKAGAMIFAIGDAGNAMYIVARGDVNIHLPGQNSQRISLKDISRGKRLDRAQLAAFVKALAIPQEAKKRLLALTPARYTGLAAELARRI